MSLSHIDEEEEEDFSGEETGENPIEEEVVFDKNSNNFSFTADQKVYWTEEQENAVLEYLWLDETWLNNKIRWERESALEQSREEDEEFIYLMQEKIEIAKDPVNRLKRDKIFRDKLEKPITKLVENIIFSFKLFRQDVDVKSLEYDSLGFLMTKFANYDPSQKTKAFSYYGTVLKHYLIGEKKDNYKDQQSNLDFDNFREEVEGIGELKYNLHEVSHLDRTSNFFNYIIDELKNELKNSNLSANDKIVASAIISIFENHEKIQIYSKNNLYQIVKEYTGLQTKEITYSLSRFKSLYKLNKQNFNRKNK